MKRFNFDDFSAEIQELSQYVSYYENMLRNNGAEVRRGYGRVPGIPIVRELLRRTRAELRAALEKHLTERE